MQDERVGKPQNDHACPHLSREEDEVSLGQMDSAEDIEPYYSGYQRQKDTINILG